MDYDLQRLGTREFEHLVQALAMAELGNGVTIFGAGPDGGREATFDGKVTFPSGKGRQWDGYGVVQAKFSQFAAKPYENTIWVKRQIDDELKTWPIDDRLPGKRSRQPKYYLLATNVRLSAKDEVGGVDAVTKHLEKVTKLHRITGAILWHYDTICRLLDQHAEIRQTYGGFITTGDVLHAAKKLLTDRGQDPDLAATLRVHEANELIAKQWIRLGEAGFDGSQRVPLADTAIDLPASVQGSAATEVQVLRQILDIGDRNLRPKHRGNVPFGVVVVGGPGQGKSTLAQLICQTYRISLVELASGGSLGPEADKAFHAFERSIKRLGLPTPLNRRWPFYLELSKFGDFVGNNKNASLMEYIAAQIKVHGEPISPKHLASWLTAWPWVVVFDGLDEVTSADARENVVSALSRFTVEINASENDVLLVATTRPQGYQSEFGIFAPEQLNLRPLHREESVAYATRLIRVRHKGDPEMIREITARFKAAASEPITGRLVRSPLQATIMTRLL